MSASENPLRNPYFGELHVHTAWSLDAFVLASLAGPDEAFRFAKGELSIRSSLNNAEENHLRRPLDFAAVTEHAEWLGEYGLVVDPAFRPAGDDARARVERYRATQVAGADSGGVKLLHQIDCPAQQLNHFALSAFRAFQGGTLRRLKKCLSQVFFAAGYVPIFIEVSDYEFRRRFKGRV